MTLNVTRGHQTYQHVIDYSISGLLLSNNKNYHFRDDATSTVYAS